MSIQKGFRPSLGLRIHKHATFAWHLGNPLQYGGHVLIGGGLSLGK
jgi:hypothetical protein